MYSVCIKIDDGLPWIELDEEFQTKTEAREAVKEKLSRAKIKISESPQQRKQVKVRITAHH